MIRAIRDALGNMLGTNDTIPKDSRAILRGVFSGQEGTRALAWILTDLGFFERAIDGNGAPLEGEAVVRFQARQDYARRLLEALGGLHEMNAEDLSKQFMDLPVWGIETDQKE